ncbi:MAG: PilT/PilU family type 4a pilus ATPase [Pirellulales bacterium]|nr:PilT/PilU family type 4a pilus ATPase [Pirellulales bacterium]
MSTSAGSDEFPQLIHNWLRQAVSAGASDLHIVAGYPPMTRLHGDLTQLDVPVLSDEQATEQLQGICSRQQEKLLSENKNCDWSFDLAFDGIACRFRANLFYTAGTLAGCIRIVPSAIPDFEWAGLPQDLAEQLAFQRDGLVILTGATGSGKTTSLAMIVDLLNRGGGKRIITVEEPVEYIHPVAESSVVTQREVGTDVLTFADGLKFGLRQDPDVILVGEIRDLETAQMVLSAAETGHLVFTTLHTRDTKGAISRFADLFPHEAQRDVRYQLAAGLRAVVGQRLLPGTVKGEKRQLALEVLWNTHPIATAIRSGKLETIDNYLLTNREDGQLSFDESIRRLWEAGQITHQTAESNMREVSLLTRTRNRSRNFS